MNLNAQAEEHKLDEKSLNFQMCFEGEHKLILLGITTVIENRNTKEIVSFQWEQDDEYYYSELPRSKIKIKFLEDLEIDAEQSVTFDLPSIVKIFYRWSTPRQSAYPDQRSLDSARTSMQNRPTHKYENMEHFNDSNPGENLDKILKAATFYVSKDNWPPDEK